MAINENGIETGTGAEENSGAEGEKTFSQEEVDEMIKTRLAKERKKFANQQKSSNENDDDRISKLEKELNEMKAMESTRKVRASVAKEMNVPAELLTGKDEDDCKAQAKALLAWKGNSSSYPDTKKPKRRTSTEKSGSSAYDNDMREFAASLFGEE